LAAAGHSGPDIAQRLFISPGTVKTHFANIYEKLGVSDRTAAVAYALRNRLISLAPPRAARAASGAGCGGRAARSPAPTRAGPSRARTDRSPPAPRWRSA